MMSCHLASVSTRRGILKNLFTPQKHFLRFNSNSSSSSSSKVLSRNETYFRRVTKPDQGGPLPSRFQRGAQLLGGILAILSTSYFVLWADFGPREHCFSPLRRLLQSEEFNPFSTIPSPFKSSTSSSTHSNSLSIKEDGQEEEHSLFGASTESLVTDRLKAQLNENDSPVAVGSHDGKVRNSRSLQQGATSGRI